MRFDAGDRDSNFRGQKPIPGFDLSIIRNQARSDVGFSGLVIERTDIVTEVDEKPFFLLAVADLVDLRGGANHRRAYPKEVEGYRGKGAGKVGYGISQKGFQGDIVVELHNASKRRSATNEPFGYSRDIPPRQIGDLPEWDHKRLEIVSSGILSRLAAVRLILNGSSARDVLMAAGHDVQYVAPDESESSAVEDPFNHGETFSHSA